MTLKIDLHPDIERGLLTRAHAKGVSLADFAREVLAREAKPLEPPQSQGPASEAGNLYDLFAPVRGLLTDEEIDLYFTRTPSSSRPFDFELIGRLPPPTAEGGAMWRPDPWNVCRRVPGALLLS
jgi:hypothetical protein